MRAPLSVCLALLVLAASGCHAPAAAPRGAVVTRVPVVDHDGAAPSKAGHTPHPGDERPVAPETSPGDALPVAAVLAAPSPSAASAASAASLDSELRGTIVARQGDRITIRVDADTSFATGERAQLLRHFERKLGSATVTGWLDVARVTVLARDGRSVELSIDEETARVMVNGRKQDQFRPGFLVRLEST